MLEDQDGENNKPPIIQEEAVNDLLCHLDNLKSMGPDGIHPRVLRELPEEPAKPLSITYQQCYQTREVPDEWRIANMTTIYEKGWKEYPSNYRPVSLTSVLGKIMEGLILSSLTRHMKDNQGIRPSQHGFMKDRSCLTTQISFYDQVTLPVRETLWILFTWTLVRPLTLFPTVSSWRNWLLMVCMGVHLTG